MWPGVPVDRNHLGSREILRRPSPARKRGGLCVSVQNSGPIFLPSAVDLERTPVNRKLKEDGLRNRSSRKMKLIISILGLLAASQAASGLRILALSPLAGRSHFIVMESISLELASRGHQVDMVSHFPRKKPVPNYRDISLEGTADIATNSISVGDTRNFSGFSMTNFTSIAGDKVCSLMGTQVMQDVIKSKAKGTKYDIIIVELFVANCYLAFGRHFDAPVVGIAASSLLDWFNEPLGNPMNNAFVPSVFSMFGQRMTFWERVRNTFLSSLVTAQLNYYMEHQKDSVKEYMNIDVDYLNDLYKEIGLVLVNSHHTLHGVRPFSTGIIEVGGLHVNDKVDPLPSDVQKWLDEAKDGCIFFTFGSMVRIETLPDDVVRDIYKVFEKMAPVRVMMKVAHEKDLLKGLPSNVMIKPWFNQKAILKHKNIKVFITHGGLMSTLEAVHFGVPLVGIPLFGDQHINIKNYVDKKMAVSLNNLGNITESSLTDALNTILHNKEYSENTKTLSKLFKDRPMSAMDTAVYWVEYVARNGKILQSPVLDLNWFQRNLIDVYAFLIGSALLALYIAYRMVRCLLRMICSKACSTKHTKVTSSKKNK